MSALAQHRQVFGATLRRLAATPFSTLLNVAVIGVALALPAGTWAVLENLRAWTRHMSPEPQLSVYLDVKAGTPEADAIKKKLKGLPTVKSFRFVPRDAALAELRGQAGLADVVDSLPANPLPHAFVIDASSADAATLEGLRAELERLPAVAHVQVDSEWARRLEALLGLGRTVTGLVAALLACALVAVTFNTIRLQILSRRDEIEVARLIGATRGFVRRPFLYHGAIQGLLGGAVAWAVVALSVALLQERAAALLSAYGVDTPLAGLPSDAALALLAGSALLGWLGAWLSVSRHLRETEPR